MVAGKLDHEAGLGGFAPSRPEGSNADSNGSAVLELVAAIHATPHKMVMAFAGAGAQALAWLHAVGGSSRTILSALDIYGRQSMRELVGFMPAKFTSRRVARVMANATHGMARRQLAADASDDPAFGLGSTATIATDRAKRGDHRVAVAVRDPLGTVTYSLTLEKGKRDRAGEEALVSQLLLRAAAEACGVLSAPPLPLTASETLGLQFHACGLLGELAGGRRSALVVRPNGQVITAQDLSPSAILSGAFNPVHAGHLELARAAAHATGLPTLFELPLLNAAKAPIPLVEARRRALQFGGRGAIALTRSPLFADKAALFPGSVFVVGSDTAERILQPRFYDGSESGMIAALETVRAHGCRFLVAGRKSGGEFRTLAQLGVPAGQRDLFEPLTEGEFRNDLSSSEIRKAWSALPSARG